MHDQNLRPNSCRIYGLEARSWRSEIEEKVGQQKHIHNFQMFPKGHKNVNIHFTPRNYPRRTSAHLAHPIKHSLTNQFCLKVNNNTLPTQRIKCTLLPQLMIKIKHLLDVNKLDSVLYINKSTNKQYLFCLITAKPTYSYKKNNCILFNYYMRH